MNTVCTTAKYNFACIGGMLLLFFPYWSFVNRRLAFSCCQWTILSWLDLNQNRDVFKDMAFLHQNTPWSLTSSCTTFIRGEEEKGRGKTSSRRFVCCVCHHCVKELLRKQASLIKKIKIRMSTRGWTIPADFWHHCADYVNKEPKTWWHHCFRINSIFAGWKHLDLCCVFTLVPDWKSRFLPEIIKRL